MINQTSSEKYSSPSFYCNLTACTTNFKFYYQVNINYLISNHAITQLFRELNAKDKGDVDIDIDDDYDDKLGYEENNEDQDSDFITIAIDDDDEL